MWSSKLLLATGMAAWWSVPCRVRAETQSTVHLHCNEGSRDTAAIYAYTPDINWVRIPAGHVVLEAAGKTKVRSFEIARYPITNAQFQAFVEAGRKENPFSA